MIMAPPAPVKDRGMPIGKPGALNDCPQHPAIPQYVEGIFLPVIIISSSLLRRIST
jgi:hypothetical protein